MAFMNSVSLRFKLTNSEPSQLKSYRCGGSGGGGAEKSGVVR